MNPKQVDLNEIQTTIFKELLSGQMDYKEAVIDFFHALLQFTNSEYGYIAQFDQKKKEYKPLSCSTLNWKDNHAMPLTLPLEAEIKRATEQEKPILLKGLKNPEFPSDQVYSCWILPLSKDNKTQGLLCLAQKGDAFSSSLSEQLSPFTETLRLFIHKLNLTTQPISFKISDSGFSLDSPEILKKIVQLSELGIWILSLIDQKIYCSSGFYKILERKLPENTPELDDIMQFIAPSKRKEVKAKWMEAKSKKKKISFTHQFLMPDGTSKDVETSCEVFSFEKRSDNPQYIIGSCRDISQQKKELEKKRRFDKVLLQLSKDEELQFGKIEDYLKKLLQITADVLNSRRVSIWTFNNHYNEIHCYQLFDKKENSFSLGEVLRIKDFPQYFNTLLNIRNLSVTEARNDYRTSEFTENYLKKHDIYSMLDTQIWHSGKVFGVFCVEHTDTIRQWTQNEENFAASLAEFISLAFGVLERNNFTEALKESEKKYHELFEGTPLPLMLIDNHSFDILDVNKAAVDEYGYSFEEFKNLKLWDIRPHTEVEKLKKKLTSPRPVKEKAGIWLHQRKDKSLFFAEIIVHQVEIGGRRCSLSHIQNISEQIEAHEKNEVLIRNLRDIATLTSHELRGPLARILGLVSIFDDKEEDKLTNAEIIKRLKQEARALDHIIGRMVRKTEQQDQQIRLKKSS